MIILDTRSRDIKSILKRLRPYIASGDTLLYTIVDGLTTYHVLARGRIKTRYVRHRHRDYLSGVVIGVVEADILLNKTVLFRVRWAGTHYTIEFNKRNPYIIIVVAETLDLRRVVEGSACTG